VHSCGENNPIGTLITPAGLVVKLRKGAFFDSWQTAVAFGRQFLAITFLQRIGTSRFLPCVISKLSCDLMAAFNAKIHWHTD
jgi:hypothetical protein